VHTAKMSAMASIEKINLSEKEVMATRGIGVRQLRLMRMRGVGPDTLRFPGALVKPEAVCFIPSRI